MRILTSATPASCPWLVMSESWVARDWREAHVWPYGLLPKNAGPQSRAFDWTFAGQQQLVLCSSSDLRDQDCEQGEGRGTLIGIMGAVTRGDGRE